MTQATKILDLSNYVAYEVTGLLFNSTKRFKRRYPTKFGWRHAFCINLWRGSVWGVLPNGKRKLLKRVYN